MDLLLLCGYSLLGRGNNAWEKIRLNFPCMVTFSKIKRLNPNIQSPLSVIRYHLPITLVKYAAADNHTNADADQHANNDTYADADSSTTAAVGGEK